MKAKSGVSSGIIGDNCETHSGGEWLEILTRKSRDKGKALSWYEIKMDPEINHLEISKSLGPYVNYERKLKEAVQAQIKTNPQVEPKCKSSHVAPKDDAKTVALKAKPNNIVSFSSASSRPVDDGKRITSFEVPRIGSIVHAANSIVLVRLDEGRTEHLIEDNEVTILSKPGWFEQDMVGKLLAGFSDLYQISAVTIYHDYLELEVERFRSEKAMKPFGWSQIRIKLTQQSQYMIALYLFNPEFNECKDYIILQYNPNEPRTVILEEERFYVPEDKIESSMP